MKRLSLQRNAVGIILVALCLAVGCGFKVDKGNPATTAAPAGPPTTNDRNATPAIVPGRVMGYNNLKAVVFEPRCTSCHGNQEAQEGLNLETYAGAQAVIKKIDRKVFVKKNMPPSDSPQLNDTQLQLLRAWIDAGGPENDVDATPSPQPSAAPSVMPMASPSPSLAPSPEPSAQPEASPSPSPDPSPSPEPTPSMGLAPSSVHFAEVNQQVFQKSCLKCHDVNGSRPPRHGVALNTYDDVMKNISKIKTSVFDPNTPEDKQMPPKSKPRLTDEQLELLRAWIDEGAQP